MTMGALHEGHALLIRRARAVAESVIVTIFLNPLQFAAGEDLDRYPKTFDSDLRICTAEGVDVVFAPTPDVVYPTGDPAVVVSAGALGDRLEGEHRPGHFDGVLTVVAKLLHLTRPDLAFFGEKDAQQLALIRRMVRDLDFPVEVVAVPTVREDSGLALSSRNTYLSDSDRTAARSLNKALMAGASAAGEGGAGGVAAPPPGVGAGGGGGGGHLSPARGGAPGGAAAVLAAATAVLDAEAAVAVDYVSLVDEGTWEDADESTRHGRLLVAARVGTTRLIDNVSIVLTEPGGHGTTSAPDMG